MIHPRVLLRVWDDDGAVVVIDPPFRQVVPQLLIDRHHQPVLGIYLLDALQADKGGGDSASNEGMKGPIS